MVHDNVFNQCLIQIHPEENVEYNSLCGLYEILDL